MKYCPLFFIVILIFSCKNKFKDNICKPVVDSSMVQIDLDKNGNSDDKLNRIIEVKEIIPLETKTDFYIADITQCLRLDSLILLLDAKYSRLLIYRQDGRLLREIGRLGDGIGEFENISNFFVDERKRLNLFSSESMKMLMYDIEGKFIGEKKVPFYAQSAIKISPNQYAFYTDYNKSEETGGFNLVFTDSLLKVRSFFSPYPDNPDGPVLSKISGGMFQSNTNSLIYGAFQDSIFEITDDSKVLKLKYVLNIKTNKIPEAIKADPSNSLKSNPSRVISYNQLHGAVFQTNSLLSFIYLEKRIPQQVLYDKIHRILIKNSKSSGFPKCLGKTIGVYSEDFISYIDPDTYKRVILDNPDVELYLKQLSPILYKALINMYTKQTNPTLVIWGPKTIKKNIKS
ncbi:6-bladed beta-propeller [Mucilaginibacter daejeonensis]|uniref:6-bladed beta-propeller n=1 Tax=Mucilaginibacter daejeonensis TaxID=398049 RepID=UPI001D17C190|nr:6-bladed beta-propeller [Mucilaginibacter daejeonensis]UEG54022.1 6-bladed beta-propeller [Mucilaginibacter daejeonensis]